MVSLRVEIRSQDILNPKRACQLVSWNRL